MLATAAFYKYTYPEMQSERKATARVRLLNRRNALPAAQRAEASAQIRALLEPLTADSTVFCYYPVNSEVDLLELHRTAATFALPRVNGNRLDFCAVQDPVKEATGRFRSIAQPPPEAATVTADSSTVLLVPAIAYTRAGYRLGYGGGYYDRLLAGFPGTVIGVCYRELLVESLPLEAHDLPVATVCSEAGLLECAAYRQQDG